MSLALRAQSNIFHLAKRTDLSIKNKDIIDRFYNLPELKSNRSTSFGYGPKIDNSIKLTTPSPGEYIIKSEFEISKNKGVSFRAGWKEYKNLYQKEGYLNTLKVDQTLPGPGHYPKVELFGKEGLKFTLKSRFKDRNLELKMLQSPGPGTYSNYSYFPHTSKAPISTLKINTGTSFGHIGKSNIINNS